MSLHSQPVAQHQAATPEFPRHVVTAVLVSHDGARWLPEVLSGLLGQERPVQNVIAADTGSADDSAGILTERLGAERVLHLARRSGFGTAVDEAARTAGVLTPEELPYLKRPSGWDPITRTWHDEAYEMPELPYGEPVQWLWLLHDDCAPEPDALGQLLRVVDADESVSVAGPKLRSWYDHRQLLEAGVSIANSGRRWTGIERREQDQGQHDQVRPVLSVSTAGMLIRRDVFEQLAGFDRNVPLMRDDVDLCWRAQSAGHRVLVVPDAVVRHAEAASRERRPVDCVGRSGRQGASPHRVDKTGAVYTLLANAPARKLPWVVLRLVLGTLLRTLAYLVGKVPRQALDEVAGLSAVLLRPGRVVAARRRRGRPQVAPQDLRPLFPPPGATIRATVEQVFSNLAGRSAPEASAGGRHGAIESGPSDEVAEFLDVEQFARVKRLARRPAPVLFAVLLLVSLVACRALLGGGALAGGALLPAPESVGELWSQYLDAWHPVGIGGTQEAPPYLALVAAVATLFLGSTGFALTLLLVCSVPLAGLTAYFASRPLVGSRLIRAWASVAYAFLPAATGALAGGRIGTAVLAMLLPLLARAAVAASGLRGRGSWRAAWAYALLLTLVTAFTPVVWPLALVLTAALVVLRWRGGAPLASVLARCAAWLVTPLVVLAPWSLSLLAHPGRFLDEAGLAFHTDPASVWELLAVNPGGPGTAGGLVLIGLVLAALAALLRTQRRRTVQTAWAVALVGLLFAGLAGGSGWGGPASLVYGLGLLTAGAVGAEGARGRVAAQSFGWRQPAAVLVAAAAALGPLVSAFGWMIGGADGPLSRRDATQVPAFVAEESNTRDQARTLVLAGGGEGDAGVSYALVRGSGARLGDAELSAAASGQSRLDRVVSHLVAGSGADQSDQLGDYAVGYILVRDGAPREMRRVLDTTPGLTRLSQEDGSALWRVERDVSRAVIVQGEQDNAGGGAVAPVAVAAGPVEVRARIPDGPSGRVLRLADSAAAGWQATLDGRPLSATTVDGWAQGFSLPAKGGQLEVTYETPLTHTGWLTAQGFLLLVVLVLALPGGRRTVDDDLPEAPDPAEGEGRRARRLRAAASAESGTQSAPAEEASAPAEELGELAGQPGDVSVPVQHTYDDGYGEIWPVETGPYDVEDPYGTGAPPGGDPAPYAPYGYPPVGSTGAAEAYPDAPPPPYVAGNDPYYGQDYGRYDYQGFPEQGGPGAPHTGHRDGSEQQ